MACKFKFGDKVKVAKHFGKISSVKSNGIDYICRVKFDNGDLIPNEMEYKESEIDFINGGDNSCPICHTPWTETKFGNKVWKDCNRCGKKSEDILAMKEENSKIKTDFTGETNPYGSFTDKTMDDLAEELEKLDFDDFGFYQP